MQQKTCIEVRDLDYTIDSVSILQKIRLEVRKGEFVGVVGPNGSGKTTLLKNIYRVYQPTHGTVLIDGMDIQKMKPRETARKMSVLAQEMKAEVDFSVMEVVKMGRYAHRHFMENKTEEDEQICRQALADVGAEKLSSRSFYSLSGGEKQRVLLASAFAQQAKIILLDEPTNHLDVGHQFQIMDLVRRRKDVTVFTSLHDLNIAARYCDRLIVLEHGNVLTEGTPEEVLTPELIGRLFSVRVRIDKDEESGKINVVFLGALQEKSGS